jgi:hypothetical protein
LRSITKVNYKGQLQRSTAYLNANIDNAILTKEMIQ